MPKSSSEITANGVRVNILSLGDSGKGKTKFYGSMCDYGYKPYVIDIEKGLLSIADKDFEYDTIDTWGEFGEKCQWFAKNYKEHGYTHLVVDSMTRLQQYLITSLDKNGKLTQNQWGEVQASLRKVVDWLTKDCPTPVVVTAMAGESHDQLSGKIKVYPNIQGGFKNDLAGYFDIVLYHDCGMKNGEQQYWVQTQGDERIQARSRADCVKKLSKYEQNNYGIIHNITSGEK